MKKDKFQITMPELQQIIKEEYASMAKDAERAGEIKARLGTIKEELEASPETLSEVEAGSLKGVKSTGWTGPGEEDKKYDEKFEKIGTHLKENEEGEEEGNMEMGGEENGIEVPMDVEMEDEGGYFEMKFAELGKELDAKIGGEEMEAEEEVGMEIGIGDEGMEEMKGMEEVVSEAIEEEVVSEAEEGEEEVIKEDLEEPIEGSTPAQDSDARFNDYMEKDKHVKEGTKNKGTTLLSEGFTPERKTKLDGELERMKRLAKI